MGLYEEHASRAAQGPDMIDELRKLQKAERSRSTGTGLAAVGMGAVPRDHYGCASKQAVNECGPMFDEAMPRPLTLTEQVARLEEKLKEEQKYAEHWRIECGRAREELGKTKFELTSCHRLMGELYAKLSI